MMVGEGEQRRGEERWERRAGSPAGGVGETGAKRLTSGCRAGGGRGGWQRGRDAGGILRLVNGRDRDGKEGRDYDVGEHGREAV
eukprot:3434886-Rhodomonas_salina.2